jgi:hypothetical protein
MVALEIRRPLPEFPPLSSKALRKGTAEYHSKLRSLQMDKDKILEPWFKCVWHRYKQAMVLSHQFGRPHEYLVPIEEVDRSSLLWERNRLRRGGDSLYARAHYINEALILT